MAKTARTWAPIDVHYFEDDRVLEAGDAWQLHFASILACKRQLNDGVLTRRQLVRIAPDSLPDVARSIEVLIDVGLFVDKGTVIAVHGWDDWNDSADDVETMSRGGKEGNHLRWHVKRGNPNPECELCISEGLVAPDSPPDSPPTRDPNPRVDKRREDVDVDHSLAPTDVDAREALREAIAKACGWNLDKLTSSSNGRLAKAVKEIERARGTPAEVFERADVYRSVFSAAALTPTALSGHWPALEKPVGQLTGSELVGWVNALIDSDEAEARAHIAEEVEPDELDKAMDAWRQRRALLGDVSKASF
jgi:hypothetical protein